MTKDEMNILTSYVRENAPIVQMQLPYDARHPHGRNAIAHFYSVVNSLWEVEKLSEIPSKDFNLVLECFDVIKRYASKQDFYKFLPKVSPIKKNTLNDFFI